MGEHQEGLAVWMGYEEIVPRAGRPSAAHGSTELHYRPSCLARVLFPSASVP